MNSSRPFVRSIAIAFLGLVVVVCIYVIGTETLTSRESALLSLVLTIFSVIATWVASHWYAEYQQEATLRRYALQAAEKVNNLSSELNRLAYYLQEELESDQSENLRDVVHSRNERMSSAIHLIATLRVVNDGALSDWEGVIGEEIDRQREVRRERESEMQDVVEKVEELLDEHRTDAIGLRSDNTGLRHELKTLRTELRAAAASVAIPSRTSRGSKKRLDVSVECPNCGEPIQYRQRPTGNGQKGVECDNCSERFVSRWSGNDFRLEPRTEIEEIVECPSCSKQISVLLDNIAGASKVKTCEHCSDVLRVARTPTEVKVTDAASTSPQSFPKRIPTEAEVCAVLAALPPQPWPTGTHQRVAEQLHLQPSTVSRSIDVLIDRGSVQPQTNGVVLERRPGKDEKG